MTWRPSCRPLGMLLLLAVFFTNGCSGEPGVAGDGDAAVADAPAADARVTDGGTADALAPDAGAPSCPWLASPPDGERRVVVSHPYDGSGGQANVYEVLTLGADGVLATTGTTFTMGRSTTGEIAFTPDGRIGLVAQEDGTLGVFRFDDAGVPQVVHAALGGSFYAGAVVIDPAHARGWVLDMGWREHGGGLYAISIACDGTVSDEGLAVPAKLPYALAVLGDRAYLAAKDALDSIGTGGDLYRLRWNGAWENDLEVDLFADDEQIVSAMALTSDGRYVLVGDNNSFSASGNRIGVAEDAGDALSAVQTLAPLEDPFSIVTSPSGGEALVVSGFGDAFFRLDVQPGAAPPFTLLGEVPYAGAAPELPGAAVLIRRGALRGRVLVAENLGVRQVDLTAAGDIVDLGRFSVGSGLTAIVGAIGVTP